MSSIDNNAQVQLPPLPPPPPPIDDDDSQAYSAYGPNLPGVSDVQSTEIADADVETHDAATNPADISADNHPVESLSQWKSPQSEVVNQGAANLPANTLLKADLSASSPNDISGGVNAKFEAAPPDDLWSNTTRAVSNFTNGLMNGRPDASDGAKVDTNSLAEMEKFSVLPQAMQAGVNVRETYDRLSTAMDEGLTGTQKFGNDLANRDLLEGVDQTKLADGNGANAANDIGEGGGNPESLKIGANYVAKVAGEGIDLVAGLGKAAGSVINSVPKWASEASDLATGKQAFNLGDAAAGVVSGVGKVGYGIAAGLAVDLPSRILAPGEGHDVAANAVGDVQKGLDDAYRGGMKTAGLNPDSTTYKTVSSATEVVGAVGALFIPGAKGAGATEGAGSAIVAAEKGGALVKAEGGGALVKTEQGGGAINGSGTTPQKLLTGTPDRPLLTPSMQTPLPDLASLDRDAAQSSKAGARSTTATPVEVEVMPPESAVSPNQVASPEGTTIDVTPSASRRAYTEIAPSELNFPTRTARDGTTIVSESYKGPTAQLQRDAFRSQFEMRSAQEPGMQPHIEIIDKASGKVVGEVPNARLETPLDFGVNVGDRLTKPTVATQTGVLAGKPELEAIATKVADALGRVDKASGLFKTLTKLWNSLTNPTPSQSGAPSNIKDQLARHKEMMSEIESQTQMSDPTHQRTVDKSALPENRTVPGQNIQRPPLTSSIFAPLGEPLPDLNSIPRNQPFQPEQQNRQPLDLGTREPEFVELPNASEQLNPEAMRLPPPGFDPGELSPARRAEYDANPQAYLRKYFDN